MMRVIERLVFTIVFVATIPLMLLWFTVPAIGGFFIGLPIAGVKFILTGRSGIEWYLDNVLGFVQDNCSILLWLDSLEERA